MVKSIATFGTLGGFLVVGVASSWLDRPWYAAAGRLLPRLFRATKEFAVVVFFPLILQA